MQNSTFIMHRLMGSVFSGGTQKDLTEEANRVLRILLTFCPECILIFLLADTEQTGLSQSAVTATSFDNFKELPCSWTPKANVPQGLGGQACLSISQHHLDRDPRPKGSDLAIPAFLNICLLLVPLHLIHFFKVPLEVTGDDVVASLFWVRRPDGP